MEAGTWDQRPEVMAERLAAAREDLRDLKSFRRIAEQAQVRTEGEIESLEEAVKTIAKGLEGVRTTLTRFAFTVAGSAIVFSFSVLVATGKI